MKNAILFGNGINRSCGADSWDSLLKEIANSYFAGKAETLAATLEYEKIANLAIAQNKGLSVDDFCIDTIQKVDSIPEGYREIYEKYLSIPADIFLTTNYDYAIERTIIEEFTYENYKSQVKYQQEKRVSNRRHIVLNGKSIYHIHGELSSPASICLGTVHYATNLYKIIDSITEKDENDNLSIRDFSKSGTALCSWAECFFTHNIFIIGLGLAECDIDLWWLITYRAQLIAQGTTIKNRIVFFYTYEGTEKDTDLIECLKACGIEVKEYSVNNNEWKEAYKRIANSIII